MEGELEALKAIVLAGGFATRLRPLTLTKPKPLLPILGRPLLDWILESLAKAGFREVILSVRYMADKIKSLYDSGSAYGLEVTFVEEERPLGDAGPLRLISEKIGLDETFMVVYGDVFTTADLRAVYEYHKRMGGLATVMLVEVEDPSRYGVAVLDSEGRIVTFVEKPPRDRAPSRLANAGIYVFEPEVVNYVPAEKASPKIAKDVLPRIVGEGRAYGYVYRGLWSDIGVPKDYMRANMEALEHLYPQGFIASSARVEKDAEIVPPVYVGERAVVKKGARVGPFAVLDGEVIVEEGALVERSVVLMRTRISRAAVVRGSIVGEGCYVGPWSRIEEGSIVGDEVVIGQSIYVARNTVILPYKEIGESVYEEGKIVL